MFGYFFKALAIMGIIAEWSDRALEDGEITAEEGFELLMKLASSLGLPLRFTLPQLSERIAEAPAPEVPALDQGPPPRPGYPRKEGGIKV